MNSTQIDSKALAARMTKYFRSLRKAELKLHDEVGGRLFIEMSGGQVTSVGISFGNPNDRAMHESIRACPSVAFGEAWQEERSKPEETRAWMLDNSELFAEGLIGKIEQQELARDEAESTEV